MDNTILSHYQKCNDFMEIFDEFKKHRKKLKKPMTDYAEHLILRKLDRLSQGHQLTAIAILEQSIEQGWHGVFPLRSVVTNCPYCGSGNIATKGNKFMRCYSCNNGEKKEVDEKWLDIPKMNEVG